MASPQAENFTQIPNDVLDAFVKTILGRRVRSWIL